MGYCLTKAKLSQGFSVAKRHCLANNNSQINLFVWDPTEPIATRPLFMLANPGNYKFFYTFDGNKNVSELVHFETRNGIAAHYDYAPLIDDEPKPSSDDCLQSSKCKSSWGAYYAVVEDILENQNFTLPSTVEKKVKMLNENKCKRYRCVIKYFPPIRRGVY